MQDDQSGNSTTESPLYGVLGTIYVPQALTLIPLPRLRYRRCGLQMLSQVRVRPVRIHPSDGGSSRVGIRTTWFEHPIP